MGSKYNDFTGFTFNDIHSSDLHIIRTSEGDRYNETLTPSFQDKTVQVGGRDGTYIFGSYYQKKDIPISIAFDNMGEEEFRQLRNWGADKKIHKLIFDESPYKYYNAKLQAPTDLKYVCFDESEKMIQNESMESINRKRRIYKGEGTLKFTCYESFARSIILNQTEAKGQEVEFMRVYLNKTLRDCAFEIPLKCLDNVDEVSLYLSRDFLYDRGEWGAPNLDENGNYAAGQVDPKTGKPSTSYYAFQPQRVRISRVDGNSTAHLTSDYQTYLFPINLNKGFMGQVDTRTFVTNGVTIDRPILQDSQYDWHSPQRRTEIVQYDPQLKVTYGVSSEQLKNIIQEYGCYVYDDEDQTFKPKRNIDEIYAYWENGELVPNKENRNVYQKQSFETVDELIACDKSDWDYDDYHRVFVIEKELNSYLPTGHSIYLQPNNEERDYFLECRYIDTKGQEQVIKMEIHLVDEDVLTYTKEGKENTGTCVIYYKPLYGNFEEWQSTINLPAEKEDWNSEGTEFKITNCGDIDMPFQLLYEKENLESNFPGLELTLPGTDKVLKVAQFNLMEGDKGIIIDTYRRVIQGFSRAVNEDKIIYSKNLYNRFITEGDFFNIPVGKWSLTKTDSTTRPEMIYEYRYL